MSNLEMIVRFKIRPGQLEGFKAQAAEVMRLVRERDTGTLRYDWFVDEDALEGEIHEVYADERALMQHGQNIAPAREAMFRDYAYDHRMSAYGDISPQFVAMARERAGGIGVHTFLQGLRQAATV